MLDNDGAWCSTEVDDDGVHVSGQGKWGICGPGCPIRKYFEKHFSNQRTYQKLKLCEILSTFFLQVESLSHSLLSNVFWLFVIATFDY